MKKINITVGLFFLFICTLNAQSEWEAFSVMNVVNEIEIYDNKAYVTNRGGLLVIDLETYEEKLWTSSNSSFRGSGSDEIEILSNGQMWVSNYSGNGLLYFDGTEFTEYYYPYTDQNIDFVDNLVTHDDVLWFRSRYLSSDNGKLFSFQNGEFVHQANLPIAVRTLCFDPEGILWISSSKDIFRLENSELFKDYTIPDFDQDNDYIRDLLIDKSNRHWISVNKDEGAEILMLDQGTWTKYDTPTAPYKLIEKSDGISFNLDYSIGHITEGQISIEYSQLNYPNVPTKFGYRDIIKYQDAETMWMYAFNGYDSTSVYRINQTDTLAFGKNENYLHALSGDIEKDCQGNLYSNDRGSIMKYNGEWKPFNYEARNPDCSIKHLRLNPHTCEMWGFSSTPNCLDLFRINGSEIIEVDILPMAGISSMTFDKESSLYISISDVLYQINDLGVVNNISLPDDTWTLSTVHYGDDNSLWLIGKNTDFDKIILRLKDDVWTVWNESEFSLDILHLYDLYEDREKNIWVFFHNGVSKFNGSDWEEYLFDELYEGSKIYDMVQDISGDYWLASYRNGIAKWDGINDPIFYDVTNSDIQSNSCFGLEIVKDSILWVEHSIGLSKMKIDNLPTSTEEIRRLNTSPAHFTLYPNPSHDGFTLSFPHPEKRKIEIFNISGQLIYSTETFELELELELELSSGCNWIKASGASGMAIEKVVVY